MFLTRTLKRESGLLSKPRLRNQSGVISDLDFRLLNDLKLNSYGGLDDAHQSSVTCLDIENVDGRYLLSGNSRGEIYAHDLQAECCHPATKKPIIFHINDWRNPQRHQFSVETVQWYPPDTGIFTSSGMDGLLKIWDTNNLTVAEEFSMRKGVKCHDLQPNGGSLIAACLKDFHCNDVCILDMKSGSSTHRLKGHTRQPLCSRFSPRYSTVLVTAGHDRHILLWDIRAARKPFMSLDKLNCFTDFKPNTHAHDNAIHALKFSADGLFIVSLSNGHHLHIWNAITGKKLLFQYPRLAEYVNTNRCVQFSLRKTGKHLLAFIPVADNIAVIDLFSGKPPRFLGAHVQTVNACCLHPNLPELYSGASDKSILHWIPFSYEQQCSLFSLPDSKTNSQTERNNDINGLDSNRTGSFASRIAGAADDWDGLSDSDSDLLEDLHI